MVDLKPTNLKLQERARRLVSLLTGHNAEAAQAALDASGGQVKPATVMLVMECDFETAQAALQTHQGKLRAVLESIKQKGLD